MIFWGVRFQHSHLERTIRLSTFNISRPKAYYAVLKRLTLRSTLDRVRKMELNSGSVSIVRHFPDPCLTTPAFSAASSSAVHFCLGAPMEGKPGPFL
ncbi:telomere repeat-binding factor [Trifolium repens]|nr:telomere repeat-binding factor [Trifolium repens]